MLEPNICDALRDLVLFVQFKKGGKYPWRSVNFSKVAGGGDHGCFSRFLNCTNGTKSGNAQHLLFSLSTALCREKMLFFQLNLSQDVVLMLFV